jgi:flagellar FliL protein
MATGDVSEAAVDEGGEAAAAGRAKVGKRKLIAIIAAVVVLLAGGGAGAYLSGVFGGGEAAAAANAAKQPVFYALPEMIVTLNTGERKSTFMKLKLNLELGDGAQAARIDPLLPRVTDTCYVFLRDLRLDDLQGSAGTARLHTELLRRITLALAPIPIKDVLIAEMLIN